MVKIFALHYASRFHNASETYFRNMLVLVIIYLYYSAAEVG